MTGIATQWSDIPDGRAQLGRRDLLVVTAGAAASLLIAGRDPLARLLRQTATTPAELVRSFPKSRWDWTVELAVLSRLDADRAGALALLWAALELDLDRGQKWRRKPALRLYDLYAAASDPAGRAALAALVRARTTLPALLARATLWSDASRPAHPRLWRTVGPNRQPLGIHLIPS
jgi:hypothetical protein